MKRFTILALVLITFIIASCEDSSVNPADVNNPNGSYFPLAVGNYWIYEIEEGSGADVQLDTIRYEVSSTVKIEGETWFNSGLFILPVRWENDTLYEYRSYGKDALFINENMKAGDTLYYTAVENDISSAGSLILAEESGIVKNVNGRNYSNVVQIRHTNTKIDDGIKNIDEHIYSFAKGVGFIELISEDRSMSLIEYHIEN